MTDPKALVVVDEQQRASIMPVFNGKQISEAVGAYREVQKALDAAMPDQIMQVQGKPFRKKGYWRAVKAGFGVSVTCVKEDYIVREKDWGYVVTYRATKGPMSADGDGACFKSEKERGRMIATEHNVRSHAHTRAFNRAVSNLVGFGEVSAEEVMKDEKIQDAPPTSKTVLAATTAYAEYKAAFLKTVEAKINKATDLFPEPNWFEYDEVSLTENVGDIKNETKSLLESIRVANANNYFDGEKK